MKEKPAIRLENIPGFAAWIRNGPNAFGLPRPRLTASPTKIYFFKTRYAGFLALPP